MKTKPAYTAHDEGRKLLEKEPEKALAKADEALRAEPREALFHGLRGDALKRLGRVAEAEKEYDEAVRRDGDYFAHYLNRGLTRQQQGNKAGAQSDLERANSLLPTAAAHYVLGNLAQGTGNPAKAIEHYRLAAGSDSEVGKRAGTALVRLDLPRNPAAYVLVEPVADKAGNLALRVTNRSPASLHKLRVAAVAPGFAREYTPSGELKSGQSVLVGMNLRAAELGDTATRLRGQLRGAEVAE